MAESKYLDFIVGEPKRKTVIVSVRSKSTGNSLGIIQWYGRWRQYVFYPANYTIFNPGCLQDICAYIAHLMSQRFAERVRSGKVKIRPASAPSDDPFSQVDRSTTLGWGHED